MQIAVPEIVPIATENVVILVFVVRAKGREFWKECAKLLTGRRRSNGARCTFNHGVEGSIPSRPTILVLIFAPRSKVGRDDEQGQGNTKVTSEWGGSVASGMGEVYRALKRLIPTN